MENAQDTGLQQDGGMQQNNFPAMGEPGSTSTSALGQAMQNQLAEENLQSEPRGEPESRLLAGNFKDVDSLEEGYKELRAAYSGKVGEFHGKPEDGYYAAELPEGTSINYDNPAYQKIEDWCANNNLSQEGYDDLMSAMVDYGVIENGTMAQQAETEAADTLNESVRELGGWPAMQGKTDQIASGLATMGLEDSEINSLIGSIQSAADFKAISKLVSNASYSQVPGAPGSTQVIDESFLTEELRKHNSLALHDKMNNQQRIDELFTRAHPGYMKGGY
jgi:hypothetical protein